MSEQTHTVEPEPITPEARPGVEPKLAESFLTYPEMPSADGQPAPSPEAPQGAGRGCWPWVRETLVTFILALVFYMVINALTARVQVLGYSMMPTFRGGEYVLVWRMAYLSRLPERGDIVVFRDPNGPQEYIKRVIGLPGEEVLIQNGQVFIDGRLLEEPYIIEPPRYSGYWQVPMGHIFVLGDNRNYSTDSHVFGPIPLSRVIGKAVLVYWPPSDWRWLP